MKTDSYPHTITLVVGDWSDDGHGKTDTVMINANLNSKQIEKAYKKGVKVLGLDVSEEVCEEYEESTLKPEHYKILSDKGFFDEKDKEADEDNELYVDSDLFVKMYLFVVKLGEPTFEYELAKTPQRINIGGYGLFT